MSANELIPLMVRSPDFWIAITSALTTGIVVGIYIGKEMYK